MQVGLFFGSFNPIHTGHLIIANHILNFTSLKKIWFIVSPQNPLKDHVDLLNGPSRLELVKLASQTDKRFAVSDVEFRLPMPSYTIDTLTFLRGKYTKNDFHLIVGSDNFLNLSSWKSHELILKEWKPIVYMRPGFPVDHLTDSSEVRVLNPAQIDISSTKIRELIKQEKSIRYLVPEPVFKEVVSKSYYK